MGKRGRGRPRVEELDSGTEETQAKREAPLWECWPNDLKLAAIAIDRAVRLISQASMARAQDYASISGPVNVDDSDDWPANDARAKLYRRYRQWCAAMARRRWSVRSVIGIVVLDEDAGPEDANRVFDALRLFAGLTE